MIGRRMLFLLPALAFLPIAVWFALGLEPGRDPSLVPSVMIDKPVPAFDLPGLPGGAGLTSAGLKGKVTLVNLFASWCVPCRVEHPFLLNLAKDKRLEIVGIAWKNSPQDAAAFLAELGDPYARVGVDQSGRVGIDFGAYGVPESYLVDKEGRIRFRQVGPLSQEDIDRKLKPLVAELAK